MANPYQAGHALDEALRNVRTECQRAARAAEIAERHESQAHTDPAVLREFHARMAATHRRAEARHLAAARMHTAYAERLRRWVEAADHAQALPGFLAAVAETVGARGLAVAVFGADDVETLVAASDPAAREAQDLEFTLGEGPARDSAHHRRPVSAVGPAMSRRWPLYGPAVEELGIHVVAAVPVAVAATTLGALTVFEPQLDVDDDLERFYAAADTLAASVVTASIGLLQAQDTGWLPLLAEADLRPAVHQATGIVTVQAACTTADALALIRAHAFAQNRSVDDVASDIIARRLRLT